ncbi:hypothetical protein [Exiguobacterium flavidum]|uniref:hypothetical protein n=1 Tax=Exiguobacterium flavidum TaxID=2184695 RepID=UPI000DF7CB93|nr:hypothetical protein [Exiguobacterium flavidum]
MSTSGKVLLAILSILALAGAVLFYLNFRTEPLELRQVEYYDGRGYHIQTYTSDEEIERIEAPLEKIEWSARKRFEVATPENLRLEIHHEDAEVETWRIWVEGMNRAILTSEDRGVGRLDAEETERLIEALEVKE